MAGMAVQIVLTEEQLAQIARMVAEQLPREPADRYSYMVQRMGEACTKKQACDTLNVSPATLYRMLNDGRIRPACDGMRIDVRSLAAYLEGKR